MKDFNWEIFKNTHTEPQYDYMYHVHKKNIQIHDFVRGYRTLPTPNDVPLSRKHTTMLFLTLERKYNFFHKEQIK